MNDGKFFTYRSYINWLTTAQKFSTIIPLSEYDFTGRYILLRHDVDFDLDAAYRLARIEQISNIRATYFFMLTCSHYNLFSTYGRNILKNIINCGHTIGLHTEAGNTIYPDNAREAIEKELQVLEDLCGRPVRAISFHCPTNYIPLAIPNVIDAYDSRIFINENYFSDSRRELKKDPDKFIFTARRKTIQILTHPLYYNYDELSYRDIISIKLGSNLHSIESDQIFTNNKQFLQEWYVNDESKFLHKILSPRKEYIDDICK